MRASSSSNEMFYWRDGDDILVRVWARPGSGEERIEATDPFRKALLVRVMARARDGEANRAILSLVGDALGATATLESGASSRLKVVRVHTSRIEIRERAMTILASFQ